MTLALSYVSCALVVNVMHGQSSGTYYHYFDSFIQPSDVVFSVLKAVIFVTLIIAIHGYQATTPSAVPKVSAARPDGPSVPASSRWSPRIWF